MARIVLTLIIFVVFYVLEKSAYDVMNGPTGSAAGLITMVVLAAIGIGCIGFIWGAGRKTKATSKSPVRPLRH